MNEKINREDADKMCKCGHILFVHRDTTFEKGYGSCLKCSCQKFVKREFTINWED